MKKPKQQNESELHVCHKWAEVERGCGNKLSVLGGVCVCVRELALCSASFACVCSLCLHLANMQRATGQRQEQKRGHGGRGSALCCRLISRQSFLFVAVEIRIIEIYLRRAQRVSCFSGAFVA